MLSQISPLAFLSLGVTVFAALNGPCDFYGQAGTCIDSGDCAESGGSSVSGFCLNDPVNIKCCLKDEKAPATPEPASTGPCNFQGQTGTCVDVSDCATAGGSHVQNYCPNDPDNIRCCLGSSLEPPAATTPSGNSGSSGITIPGGGCKAITLDSGNKILDKWGSIVLEVGCYRDDTGDHGKGAALDFMVAAYGTATTAGLPMANWVAENGASLKLYYVIWDQKIYTPSIDGAPKPWSQWRQMKDRGSNTENHKDHVHVSFYA